MDYVAYYNYIIVKRAITLKTHMVRIEFLLKTMNKVDILVEM